MMRKSYLAHYVENGYDALTHYIEIVMMRKSPLHII